MFDETEATVQIQKLKTKLREINTLRSRIQLLIESFESIRMDVYTDSIDGKSIKKTREKIDSRTGKPTPDSYKQEIFDSRIVESEEITKDVII